MAIAYLEKRDPKRYVLSNPSVMPLQFYQKTTVYINNIPRTIGVATREGLRIYPSWANEPTSRVFIVRHAYSFSPKVKEEILNNWKASKYLETDLHDIIEDQWINNDQGYNNTNLLLEYRIHENEIIKKGGVVFIPAADCAVGLGEIAKDSSRLYHPQTIEGNIRESVEHSFSGTLKNAEPGLDFCYHIRIVDNAGVVGPKWISFGNSVYKITPVQHAGIRDGYYVTRTTNGRNGECEAGYSSDWYGTPEDIPEFVFYNTEIEARNSPKMEQLAKEQSQKSEREFKLREAEMKADRLEMEYNNLKSSHEKDRQKHINDMERLEKERDKFIDECELLKRKVQADKSSLWRKIIGDNIKYVPVIVTTIMALFKIFKAKGA